MSDDKTVDFSKARWIWSDNNKSADQKLIVRKKFNLNTVPTKAETYIACDTKFWLWVNGSLVVFEGCLFRESRNGCGYAEKVDLTPYLKEGENVLAALVWYYGNGGRNNTDSGEAGFILKCNALGLYTDNSFQVMLHPAYVKTGEPHPAYLYGGDNVGFDARLDCGDFTAVDFDCEALVSATEYENKVWGDCIESPLPLLYLSEKRELNYKFTENGATATLPYAMTLSVCFTAEAEGDEIIDIRTDRYRVNGGPGDNDNAYNGHRIEYTTEKGENTFEALMYLYGEKVILTFPNTVKIKSLSYRESGYGTRQIGYFNTNNELFNRLIEKSIRTLYVCMRNNFMDCPDRERGQWIGDVSVQAPQVFFVYDKEAQKLLKKAIRDFIYLRHGDVLVGNVPGQHSSELPSQSLVAISDYGLIGEYYHYTKDPEIPNLVLEPIVNYLKLWEMEENGHLITRESDWRWFDHLWNVDADVLEHFQYVAAANSALKYAEIIDRHEYDEFLKQRIERITDYIEKNYWKGNYYASGDFVDERANAFAVLSGLCPEERYPYIRYILISVFNSTPYMERFVLSALCEMGYYADAYKRMMSRYYNLIVNENSTLWEDFYILGTKNHAWSGSPLEIAYKYFLGLRTDDAFDSYTVKPVPGIFKEINCCFPLKGSAEHIHLTDL